MPKNHATKPRRPEPPDPLAPLRALADRYLAAKEIHGPRSRQAREARDEIEIAMCRGRQPSPHLRDVVPAPFQFTHRGLTFQLNRGDDELVIIEAAPGRRAG